MNTIIKRAVSAFIVVVLLVSLIPVANADSSELFYGRSALSRMKNGSTLVKVYDLIREGIEDCEKTIILESYGISCNELITIMTALHNDPHPYFWAETGYSYSYYSASHAYSVDPNYNSLKGKSSFELAKNRETFDNAVKELLKKAGITNGMSDFEKEKRIHDALALSITYDKNAANAHNIYGAIVDKRCVCQGYTYAFQYLLQLVGVQAHSVVGTSKDGEDHSWNLVLIDGDYYYADVTWDAPASLDNPYPESDIYYTHFNVTENQLSEDHVWESPAYGLPSCTATSAYFFNRNTRYLASSASSPKDIAALFRNGNARVYATDKVPADFGNWFFENYKEVVRLAGYDTSKTYYVSYSCKGREYHLNIYGTLLEIEAPGDLDSDGMLSAVDSNILRRLISGTASPTDKQRKNGDLDGDGRLSGVDSNLLRRRIAGN